MDPKDYPTPPTMKRGSYELAHQSQITRRDLTGEEIRSHLGAECLGWKLTPEQIEDRKAGRDPGLPYAFLVRAPNAPSLAWKAFYTEEALKVFCLAYSILVVETWPAEGGGSFKLRLPNGDTRWQPLTGGLTVEAAVEFSGEDVIGSMDAETFDDVEELSRIRSWLWGGSLSHLRDRNGNHWTRHAEKAVSLEIERWIERVKTTKRCVDPS